jgi:hypothetical protein
LRYGGGVVRFGRVALAVAAFALGMTPQASAQSPLPGGPQLLPSGGFPGLLPPFPTNRNPQPGPVPGCKRPTIRCVQTTLTAMRRLRARLGCDHRAVFTNTYITVTAETLRFLRDQPGYFDDPTWLTYLDVLFADYYFRAVSAHAAGQPVPESWRIAFEKAGRGDGAGVEDMLLGINSHVQRDQPYVYSLMGLRTAGGESRKPDHDRFNILLERSYDRVIAGIRDHYDPTVENTNPSGNPADNQAGEQLVASWREGVWRNAERLVNTASPDERRQVEASIESNAATSAQSITTNPDPPGHRAFRDGYCRKHLRKDHYRTKGLLAIRLSARRVRGGAVRFLASSTTRGPDAQRPVNGALVRFGGKRARTGANGRVTLRSRRGGRAQATFGGLRRGAVRVRKAAG